MKAYSYWSIFAIQSSRKHWSQMKIDEVHYAKTCKEKQKSSFTNLRGTEVHPNGWNTCHDWPGRSRDASVSNVLSVVHSQDEVSEACGTPNRWRFPEIGRCPPGHHTFWLKGFSPINHPFWATPNLGNLISFTGENHAVRLRRRPQKCFRPRLTSQGCEGIWQPNDLIRHQSIGGWSQYL